MNEIFERFLQRVTLHLQRYCPSEFRAHAQKEVYRITAPLFNERPKKTELEAMNEIVHYLHDAFPDYRDKLFKMERLCEKKAVQESEEETK